MQIESVQELPSSSGHEFIVTAMDVFSRFKYAYATSKQDAKTIAKVIFNIITKHAYLSTTLISDKCSAFVFHVNGEVPVILGFFLKHATTSHAQTLGLLE